MVVVVAVAAIILVEIVIMTEVENSLPPKYPPSPLRLFTWSRMTHISD